MNDAVPTAARAAEDPRADTLGPVLPHLIRQHLGRLLGNAYAQTNDGQDATDRFASFIAKLDAALADWRHDGEETAFREALLAVVPALRRFAISLTRDHNIVDDLVQETLLRAWSGRSGFMAGSDFEAWAVTILRNRFYTDAGKRRREVQDEDGAYAARLSSLPEQVGHLDLADMRSALARLSAPMREALTLVAIENLSYEAAAELMGCEMGTVKSRIWRARDQLARALGYAGDEVGQDGVMLSTMARSTRPSARPGRHLQDRDGQ